MSTSATSRTTATWVLYDASLVGTARSLAIERAVGQLGEGTALEAAPRALSITRSVGEIAEGSSVQGTARSVGVARETGQVGEGGAIQGAPRVVDVLRETGIIGLATPIYVFGLLGREATATDTDPGGIPNHYRHTAASDGSSLQLTTS